MPQIRGSFAGQNCVVEDNGDGSVTPHVRLDGSQPVASLTTVSTDPAAGPASLDNGQVRANHTMVVVTGPGVTAGSVQLQGSLDGTNWFSIGSAVSTASANTVYSVSATAPARYVRAHIATNITGGTISASVASA